MRDGTLDAQLRKLLVETNDQRRRVGQALYHFYRTLVFWMRRGRSFLDITRAWSQAGATVFDSLALTLREQDTYERDLELRRFVAEILSQLADHLQRGDHMLVPYLRWLEGRFPELTEMMRAESVASRIYDLELARELASVFALGAGADRGELVGALRHGATGLRAPAGA